MAKSLPGFADGLEEVAWLENTGPSRTQAAVPSAESMGAEWVMSTYSFWSTGIDFATFPVLEALSQLDGGTVCRVDQR